MALIFVDCEAIGGCPAVGRLTEFGAVEAKTRKAFYGVIQPHTSRSTTSDQLALVRSIGPLNEVFASFEGWLLFFGKQRHIMVSDNPAYDFQWINDGFWRAIGRSPFGHSARRISDFYAGLTGDFHNTQKWKGLRITPHTHHPVDDALGNLEAFERILKGER